ncbi:MAG: lytic transglycosylase domain-containing protein [Micavibrio sp.]|nr:lytic transglycosylase domain-containing protein [Micavibrio sp.]
MKAFFQILLFCALLAPAFDSFAQDAPIPQKKPSQSQGSEGIIDRIGSFFSADDASAQNDVMPQGEERVGKSIVEKPIQVKAADFSKAPIGKSLSSNDVELYKRIFSLQKKGDMIAANAQIKKLGNSLLIGHVLFQRYMHPTAYSSTPEELQSWLGKYGDHPGSDKIYALAIRKGAAASSLVKPKDISPLPRVREPTMRPAKLYVSSADRGRSHKSMVVQIKNKVRSLVRGKGSHAALSYFRQDDVQKYLDSIEKDVLKGEIAAGFLYQGKIDEAYTLATQAVITSPNHAPKAAWVAGLIAWHKDDYDRAAKFFELAATSPYSSGWLITAASYWAARSNMRSGKVTEISTWLQKGTEHPRTFYGLISTRALGVDFDFKWDLPTFTKRYHDLLTSMDYGARAIALAKTDRAIAAQGELLNQKPRSAEETQAYLAFAGYANLPALAMRLGSADAISNQHYYDAAIYPLIPWSPPKGYIIDRAFMHAIMKQESRFDPTAESHSGAKGLMQIIPSTARGIGGDKATMLDDPVTNLELGQAYLQKLLTLQAVDNNFLYLLIAYNAGPGNLVKWKKLWPDIKDPLLFIELIPSAETRSYIERVLANYWIYRLRDGNDLSSLDKIAAGQPAYYSP